MATDIQAIENNLRSFYDFRDKAVVHVGAGGGQLIGYEELTRSVLAVDIDREAAAQLEAAVREKGLADKVKIEAADILSITAEADVVFFEFCLHEIPDPQKALRHAQQLAPNILIIDHAPNSQWAWYVLEDEKAAQSWAAAKKFSIMRQKSFEADQYFSSYPELLAKVKVMGDLAIARISKFADQNDIHINMKYTIALLNELRETGNQKP